MPTAYTYTLTETGLYTAQAVDSSGSYETSDLSNAVSNAILKVNLSTFQDTYGALSAGTYVIRVKAKDTTNTKAPSKWSAGKQYTKTTT